MVIPVNEISSILFCPEAAPPDVLIVVKVIQRKKTEDWFEQAAGNAKLFTTPVVKSLATLMVSVSAVQVPPEPTLYSNLKSLGPVDVER